MAMNQHCGVLLMGGDYSALGLSRSLMPHGVPVRILPGPNRLATYSRTIDTVPGWPGAEHPEALSMLLELARTGATWGWVLAPAGDSEVRLVSAHHDVLSHSYRLTTPPASIIRHCSDKRLTYELAGHLGLGHPETYTLSGIDAARKAWLRFPLVLKPAMKEGQNALTIAKAWRIEDRAELIARLPEALRLAGEGGLVVQESIPDTGANQYSYCAFCVEGRPLLVMAARRTRQFPRKAGTGTFVETLPPQAFERDAEIFLKALNFTGLVEIEFMHDARDGRFKLIDVNPRLWTWHALGLAAGIDFAFAMWSHAVGRLVAPRRAAPGHSWINGLRDVPAALADIVEGRLTPAAYVRQVFGASAYAVFAANDPLPAIADIPFSLGRSLSRKFGIRAGGIARALKG
jgi:predicted ATP-grasp superfamily ATP-dependent carboligase